MVTHVKKFKALGEMAQRSRVGGGNYVRLEDYDATQSELTKARELLTDIRQSCELSKLRDGQIDAFLAHQSAPAAKGGE